MIFSVLSDRSENENITVIIVIVMIIMILRGNYYYYYYYYYKLMPMDYISYHWRDHVGWDIFNFVNFENLIYMKLYSLLILIKNTKEVKKTILKHWKRVK